MIKTPIGKLGKICITFDFDVLFKWKESISFTDILYGDHLHNYRVKHAPVDIRKLKHRTLERYNNPPADPATQESYLYEVCMPISLPNSCAHNLWTAKSKLSWKPHPTSRHTRLCGTRPDSPKDGNQELEALGRCFPFPPIPRLGRLALGRDRYFYHNGRRRPHICLQPRRVFWILRHIYSSTIQWSKFQMAIHQCGSTGQ